MKNVVIGCLALAALTLGSAVARADIAPTPQQLRVYTVELGAELSKILIDTTNWKTTEEVRLDEGSVFSPCTITRYKVTLEDNAKLSCDSNRLCFYKALPICRVSFVGWSDQPATNFLQLTKVEAYVKR
jgi:hypothetical protein